MDLFKLVGSIFINNKDANSQIDDTDKKAQNLATKIGSAMETAGADEMPEDVERNLV